VDAVNAQRPGSITIEQALRLPSLRRGAPQVLAGRRNLGRVIRWVHPSEVPNIATLLRGDELLLMTGMGIGTNARVQRRIIRDLATRGIAGLIIELGQVFMKLPPTIIEEAEANALPLVALHNEVPFIDITEEIHRELVSHQLAVLKRGTELQDRITELMLAGAGIAEILAALADAIANPVILERDSRGALYHATHRTDGSEVLAAWNAVAPQLDQGARPATPVVACDVPAAGGGRWGRVVALALDTPLDDFDGVLVERAASLVALALLRSHQETLLASRQRGSFLSVLAQERIDPRDLPGRAQSLGFGHDHGPLLPVAFTTAGDHGELGDEERWTPVWQYLRQELRTSGLPVLIGSIGTPGDALALLGLEAATDRTRAAGAAAEIARHAVRRHIGSPDLVVVAAGPAVDGWDQLAAAFRRAINTAAAARDAPPRAWHDAATPTLDGLLHTLRNNPQLREFAAQRLAPLLEHDRRRASKLLPTLEALSARNWRRTDAARLLHLNRQALYARIERIERLLDTELNDPESRLALELALRVHRQTAGERI
jgi:purine catabolism regulator